MKKFSIFALIAFAIISCSDETSSAKGGTVSINASAVSSTGKTSATARSKASTVVISDFKINLGNIEFELDQDDDNYATDPIFDDVELKGPFLLDLLDLNKPLNQLIASVDVPNAKYEEIKYKFTRSTVAGDLLGKTFIIKGTINDKPFVLWSDKDVELELDFENPSKDFTVNDDNAKLSIKIQLDSLMAEINLLANQGKLLDKDGDGVIEITTGNDDDNSSIGDKLKDILEKETSLDDED
jgi:hypothetical protein